LYFFYYITNLQKVQEVDMKYTFIFLSFAFILEKNKAASPLAAGGGRSIYALFAHVHFGKAENFARA